MPGMTGYFGLMDVGQPKPGETVVVSGAAGAVGQTVGQLAKIKGCRAVGIAGGPAKCDWVVNELGFDACIDYKAGPVKDGLKAHCPKGVDVYFDNVGGEILDAVLTRLNRKRAHHHLRRDQPVQQHRRRSRARRTTCRCWSTARAWKASSCSTTPSAIRQAIAELAGYLKDGRMKSREDVVVGIDTFPETLLKLFRGENFGKLVLQVAEA